MTSRQLHDWRFRDDVDNDDKDDNTNDFLSCSRLSDVMQHFHSINKINNRSDRENVDLQVIDYDGTNIFLSR